MDATLANRTNSASPNTPQHSNYPYSTIISFRKADSNLPTQKKDFQRYECPIPDDIVQMDTCKIALGIYQYTAIDDCSRYRVLRCYSRCTAANTVDFIEHVVEEMPYSIQRIQTDSVCEFFVDKDQKQLMIYDIKFFPNKTDYPHLNGRVERFQKTASFIQQ